MASVLSRRLGKRSLLGARISAPPLLGDGMLVTAQVPPLQPSEHSKGSSHLAALEDGPFKEHVEEAGSPNQSWLVLQPGQKVYVFYNGQENAALVDHHDPVNNEVKVFLVEQGFHVCRKAKEVRLAEAQVSPLPALEMEYEAPMPMGYSAVPVAMDHSPTTTAAMESAPRSVSRNIDVPKRKSDAAVDMDEMMAAMVLTSLSCSPVVQSPPNSDASIPASQAGCDVWKESGDMSDGGSSTTSGHWSGGSGISTPSPPHSEASPKYSSEAFSSPRADDGFETDSDPFLFEEPAPRKRKNSVKVMYKCLWPGCGKVLRSIVGIKRHVKTQHLGDGANSDQRKREEDFYYTEMQVKEEEAAAAAAPEPAGAPASPTSGSPPIVIQQAPPKPETLVLDQAVPLEPHLPPSALSQSAPSSFWHIQADHAYQALPSIQIPVSPHIFTSISWAAATSTIPTLSPVRSRSLSFSEQQPLPPPPPPILKSHLIVASPPRAPSGTRKVRGEAKKCRKVYGIEHRDQWCTACRWKKACQRFLD
ncbi:zinc finger protein 395 [Hemicordylus capensis]|uniref:zinc finger protein 395 n=1 Tax=Hemicordylus capensis TaxID=884348 RepID=UPI002302643B|nr:zinc finger protein 395 [Hemicordylus capensis]XP_053105339.1 zinc finger protein 395 [Hemicordylus capensis]